MKRSGMPAGTFELKPELKEINLGVAQVLFDP